MKEWEGGQPCNKSEELAAQQSRCRVNLDYGCDADAICSCRNPHASS